MSRRSQVARLVAPILGYDAQGVADWIESNWDRDEELGRAIRHGIPADDVWRHWAVQAALEDAAERHNLEQEERAAYYGDC